MALRCKHWQGGVCAAPDKWRSTRAPEVCTTYHTTGKDPEWILNWWCFQADSEYELDRILFVEGWEDEKKK